MDYYLLDKDNQQIGPFSEGDLLARLNSHSLSDHDWVWQEGWQDWKPVGSVITRDRRANQSPIPTAPPIAPDLRRPEPQSQNTLTEVTAPDERIVKFRAAPFVLALICFLLPFVNFSCSMQSSMRHQLTGIQMVTGSNYQAMGEVKRIPSMPPAVIAFFAAILALAFGIPAGTLLRVVSGIIAAVGVISLLVIKHQIDGEIMREGQGLVVAEFLFGFWIVVVLLSVGSVVQFYLASKAGSPQIE